MKSVVIKRTYDAPIEEVYKAISDPKELEKWMAPDPLTSKVPKFEAKVGSDFRVEMYGDKEPHIGIGEIKEVVPGKKISMTWNWEGAPTNPNSVLTLELQPKGDKTELTLTHSGFIEEKDYDMHMSGWTSCVEKLAKVL